MSISYVHRPTGRTFASLPSRLVHDGVVVHFAAIEAAGNLVLPYAGLYSATVTTPSYNAAYQTLTLGAWSYDDDNGTASASYSVESMPDDVAIQRIKQEAQRRINLLKGGSEPWRGENVLSRAARLVRKESLGTITAEESAELALLNAAGDEVDRLRSKSNELEAQYQVTPFDFTVDAAWEA